jgi:23S rRNA pseudouridine2604 synthase
LETVTKKCEVERLGNYDFRIVLTQGLNRQIRRMCEALGYEVTSLKRVRIMNVSLDIPVGEWRDITEEELQTINEMVSSSTKIYEETTPKKRNPKYDEEKAQKALEKAQDKDLNLKETPKFSGKSRSRRNKS